MKKLLAILLSVVFVLSLTACGATSEQKAEDGQPTSNSQQVEDKVTPVIESINEIGTVSLESKEKIENAKKLYNALSAEDKSKVTNYSALEAAETQYQALAKAEKDNAVSTHKSKFDVEYDKMENITWYYPKNMPEYIDERCYLIPYIGIQNDNIWICVRYNYTEDDWVFWKNLSILVDGEKSTKVVGSFNTVRDNEGGVVWEYYDDAFNINEPMDSNAIQKLEKIGNSQETIVRFEGDEYYYDLTVSNEDKSMIKDVVAFYSAFLKY